ncbi:MAG: hypothetical protein ABEH83_04230 [Halobacterium sp.]
MNLSRCSKFAVALVVLLAVAAVPAAAVSISGDAPSTVEAGQQQETTYEFTNLFENYEQWTLEASTDLTEVTWKIVTFDNAGNQVNEVTLTGQQASYQFKASSGAVRAEVTIVGTTPSPSAWSWSYDPPQTITYAEFVQAQQGGASNTLETYSTQPYTQQSQEARNAIRSAEDAIESAKSSGAGVSGAESDLQDAIEFYNGGNFEQAISNAEQAESTAKSAASSAQRTDLIIMVAAALVVLLLLAGGVYWYLQQRDSYDKLG